MGFTRRIVFISALLSIAVATLLLIVLGSTAGARARAEAAEYLTDAHGGSAPAETVSEPRAEAARPPTRGEADHQDNERRIRTIARNLLTPAGQPNQRAITALQALGVEVIPIILPRFTGEETPEQEAVLSVLEAFSEPEVAQHLMSVLPSVHSQTMARKIGGAIHTLGDARCCEQLAELTGDRNEGARLAAVIALRTCPPEACAETLVRQLKQEPSAEVRIEALESLAFAPDVSADEGIRLTLKDQVPDVRLAAVKLVAARKAVHLREELKGLTRSDPSPHVRKASAQALTELRMKVPAPPDDAPR